MFCAVLFGHWSASPCIFVSQSYLRCCGGWSCASAWAPGAMAASSAYPSFSQPSPRSPFASCWSWRACQPSCMLSACTGEYVWGIDAHQGMATKRKKTIVKTLRVIVINRIVESCQFIHPHGETGISSTHLAVPETHSNMYRWQQVWGSGQVGQCSAAREQFGFRAVLKGPSIASSCQL